MDKKLSETTNLCAEIMNRRRQSGTNSSMPFDVNVIINLSNNNLLKFVISLVFVTACTISN